MKKHQPCLNDLTGKNNPDEHETLFQTGKERVR